MIEMTRQRFEELVADALDGIPAELRTRMGKLAVVVDPYAPAGRLFGLYEGAPLAHTGSAHPGALPDRVTIFMRSICTACRSEEEVTTVVRRTVVREVAHHFGIDDGQLGELGWG